MDALQRLRKAKFQPVGSWSLVRNEPAYTLEQMAKARNVLYAFVSGTEVLYVGKTVQTLQERLNGYQKPGPSQKTNIACRAHIRDTLAAGNSVEIYAFSGNEEYEPGGFQINLAAGLEDSIISELQPKWNEVGTKSP